MTYSPVCLDCNSRICVHVLPVVTKQLVPREVELLVLLSGGLTNKEIAWRMDLVEGTVKVYLSHIFPKLGVTTRLEAALWTLAHPDLVAKTETTAA